MEITRRFEIYFGDLSAPVRRRSDVINFGHYLNSSKNLNSQCVLKRESNWPIQTLDSKDSKDAWLQPSWHSSQRSLKRLRFKFPISRLSCQIWAECLSFREAHKTNEELGGLKDGQKMSTFKLLKTLKWGLQSEDSKGKNLKWRMIGMKTLKMKCYHTHKSKLNKLFRLWTICKHRRCYRLGIIWECQIGIVWHLTWTKEEDNLWFIWIRGDRPQFQVSFG